MYETDREIYTTYIADNKKEKTHELQTIHIQNMYNNNKNNNNPLYYG